MPGDVVASTLVSDDPGPPRRRSGCADAPDSVEDVSGAGCSAAVHAVSASTTAASTVERTPPVKLHAHTVIFRMPTGDSARRAEVTKASA